MTELIARFKPGDNVPVFANAQINAGRFVKVVGAKTDQGDYPAQHCAAGERSFGVAEYDSAPTTYPATATDRRVNVTRQSSIARMVAGAAITVLDEVQSDSVGRAIPATGGPSTLLTGVVASNNAIRWTAREGGEEGDAITIALVFSDANVGATSVDVDGTDIVVTLESNDTGSGTILATAAEVIAAINEHDTASQLVLVDDEGASTGAGVVAAVAETPLAGGDEGHANGQALVAAAAPGDVIEVALY
jgi:hypothetical protein